ncbi:nitroreductase [Methanosarcina sp. 2.H.T.1A.6]|uniref:nitroreductase family protein n=1 Tax=unclassified Methanosarcina TaxID=2644672 RepID=UPI0006219F66|nr:MULTISPECIES: nitroreductase [unclassified Methanosarcina]KKG14386.1 nitroreductase [Methanosarcina sp. 2.H.T.1A.3]KKG24036.1 nitroreductase [Methanosarcina sp. 2.H.T.1A.6]KKG25216.1 nitroreductase [Methanosarcina sp. 2.H.T.1A.15]KKG27259.1 nitroreductase [Methanosarcina sp. 2.H.T.1A.8]
MPVTGESKVIDTILNRRSVREFTDRPISKDEINTILNAGRWAPSGLNNQPWRFVVVRNPETIHKLSECTHYSSIVAGAPLLIAAFLDSENSYNRTKDIQVIGASVQNMLLACCELGLGAVWLGEILNQHEKVNSILECPSKLELMAVLAIGEPAPGKRTSTRKALSELVFEDRYGQKWEE